MGNRSSIAAIAACALMILPLQASPAQTFHKPDAQDDRAIRADVDSTPATGLPVSCGSDSEAAYRAILKMWGRDPQTSPAAYRTLEQLKARNWQFRDMTVTGTPTRYGIAHAPDDYAVLHVTATNPYFTNVTAMSFSSMFVTDTDAEKYEVQSVNVYTKDSNGLADQLIAAGTNDSQADMRNMPVVAESLTSGPNNPYMADVITLTKFLGEAGGTPFCYNVRMDRARASPTTADITDPTNAPNHKPPANGPDRTIICLNRGATNTEGDFCDYGPTQPGVQNENLNLVFPFAGKVQTINAIYTMTINGRAVPAVPTGTGPKPGTLAIRLVKHEGGACNAQFDLKSPWQGFSVNQNVLAWQFSNPNDRTDSSNYLSAGNIGLCTDLSASDVQDWYMIATFYDVRNGQPHSPISVGIGSIGNFDGYDAEKQLPAVGFQWGCVIEGTPVALAAGGTMPIEQLKTGDILAGPSGTRLRVTALTPGYDKKFIKLIDAAGDSVVVTPDHPILTKHGMRRAQDVRAGDTVYGRNGPSVVRAAQTDNREQAARVYSLHLAKLDGGDIANTDDRAFFAGAILVGDYKAQEAVMRQAQRERMHGAK